MHIKALGYVVLKVRDRARAEAFYNGILGLPNAARMDDHDMTFFSLVNHHDFAVRAIGEDAPAPERNGVGLAHVAFSIGTDMEDLLQAKMHLEAAGVRIRPIDHDVTKSLYFSDADDNGIEVYVDVSDAWKDDPQLIAQIKPLDL